MARLACLFRLASFLLQLLRTDLMVPIPTSCLNTTSAGLRRFFETQVRFPFALYETCLFSCFFFTVAELGLNPSATLAGPSESLDHPVHRTASPYEEASSFYQERPSSQPHEPTSTLPMLSRYAHSGPTSPAYIRHSTSPVSFRDNYATEGRDRVRLHSPQTYFQQSTQPAATQGDWFESGSNPNTPTMAPQAVH
jgi:hypothetical protein